MKKMLEMHTSMYEVKVNNHLALVKVRFKIKLNTNAQTTFRTIILSITATNATCLLLEPYMYEPNSAIAVS